MGRVKGKSAIRLFGAFRDLRRRPYWGNHFWVEGYCVGTVGLDEEKIRKYVVPGRKRAFLETVWCLEGGGAVESC